MNQVAYRDGYEVAKRRCQEHREPDIESLKLAIDDCKEMGWYYLGSFFRGHLDAIKQAKGMQD